MTASEFVARITGKVVPAVAVPFRADRTIDEVAQARYVAYMAAQGVGAVAVWTHTGRGLHLSRDQRKIVLASWRQGVRVPIVAGVGAHNRGQLDDDAVAMAEEALSGGADAFLIHPPTPYRDLPDGLRRAVRYHEALDRLGVPMILFDLYREAGGIPYPFEVLRDLLALPSVVGIKFATLSDCVRVQDAAELVKTYPGKIAITGEDRFFGASLMWGCTSALVGIAAGCTELSVDLVSSYVSGDSRRFVELSRRMDRFARATFKQPMEGYIRRMLRALVVLGVITEASAHDPFGPALTVEDLDEVNQLGTVCG